MLHDAFAPSLLHPTGSSAGADPKADGAFCAALLPLVSRTFAPAIEALPDSLREAVRVAYLLCRIVDSIEDQAGLGRAQRTPLFDAFDRLLADDDADPEPFERACLLAGVGGDGADGRLCRSAGAVLRTFRALASAQRDAIRPHVLEMSAGMRAYTTRAGSEGLRLTDLGDLERYCYYVAGTVGNLLTALFEQQVPGLAIATKRELRRRAVSFGLGLQMVNIVKDVTEDWDERGACFLPVSLAEAHGVDIDRLLDAAQREGALAVVRAVCARAREHLARAEEYASLWPAANGEDPAVFAVRMFCVLPLALALATLREIESDEDSLRAEATRKIDRALVARIFAAAPEAARDNAALHALCLRLRRPHDA